MIVNFNTQTKANNFGMALHMNEKKIEKKLGEEMARGARRARHKLEELAQDCEIYVRPVKSPNLWDDYFSIWLRRGLRIRKSATLPRTCCWKAEVFKNELIGAVRLGKAKFPVKK